MFSALFGWTRLLQVPPGVRGVELSCDFSGGSFWDMLCGKGPENLAVVEVSAAQPYYVGIVGLSGRTVLRREPLRDARFCLVVSCPCNVFVLAADGCEANVQSLVFKARQERNFFDGPLLRW